VITFLSGVAVPPGVAFTEKPFHLIIRADVTTAIDAKRTPTTKTFKKGERRGREPSAAKSPAIDFGIICAGCGIGLSAKATPM
jgi:hypothetical protein